MEYRKREGLQPKPQVGFLEKHPVLTGSTLALGLLTFAAIALINHVESGIQHIDMTPILNPLFNK